MPDKARDATTPSPVRRAFFDDAAGVGRLLHDFNSEFGEPTPGADALAERIRELMTAEHMTVLLIGDGPDGVAVLCFRPSLWSRAMECHLAELYVVPDRRGQGLGRTLLEAAIAHARERGADRIDLGTSEHDVAARALYERLGFTNRERPPDGPIMYVYEREL
jgi:ribosomal protein S18 acetylase RimI-like enzyme